MEKLTWPVNTNIYLPQFKILYCPIAKNACTSLKGLMLELAGYDIENKDVHKLLDSGEAKLQLRFYSYDEQMSILNAKDGFRFAVIRKPVERLISAYVEKFVINRFNKDQWFHTKPVMASIQGVELDKADVERSVTFREFAHYLLNQNDNKLDTHWRTQASYLQGVRYTHLYPIEKLELLKSDLYKFIGQEKDIPHKNKATSRNTEQNLVEHPNFVDSYPKDIDSFKLTKFNFIDDALIERLKRKYAIDYAIYDNLLKNYS